MSDVKPFNLANIASPAHHYFVFVSGDRKDRMVFATPKQVPIRDAIQGCQSLAPNGWSFASQDDPTYGSTDETAQALTSSAQESEKQMLQYLLGKYPEMRATLVEVAERKAA